MDMRRPGTPVSRSARWAVAGALAALGGWIAVAFTPGAPYSCTLIGADAGVAVRSEAGQAIPAAWTVQVRSSGPWVTAEGLEDLRFAPLRLPESGQRSLQVRVTGSGGQLLAEQELTVELQPYSPNGEHCPPTVGRAVLTLSPEGEVAPLSGAGRR